MIPADLRYHKEHEWVRVDGNRATIGISDFAQQALGDIVYLNLPAVGTVAPYGSELGEVESTKTVSSVYAPVSGTVVAVNLSLKNAPEQVNQDPYENGWIAVIEMTDPKQLDALMTASQYEAFLQHE